jgi:hypothetical protein
LPEILQEIGAVAGLASVVGLAVLSALYFSQARDVKRLREWAGRAPERAEHGTPAVPGRVVAQPQRSVPARPGVPPVPGQQPASAGAGRPVAATPAGATPAAATPAAATPAAAAAAAAGARPATATPGQGPPAPKATPQGTPAPVPAAKSGEASAGGAAEDTSEEIPADRRAPEPVAAAVAPGAETTDGRSNAGSNASGAAGVASPPPPARAGGPSTPAAQRPGAAPPVPSAATRPPSRPGGGIPPRTPSEPTQIIPPPRPEPWYRTLLASPRYLVLVIAGILVLGGGVAFGISKLTGDNGGGGGGGGQQASHKGSSKKADPGSGKQRSGGAVRPGSVTVAVLNGTTVPGLAATLSDQVGAAGFKVGTIANFTDQQLAESVVQYAPGHEREAAAVARKVGIGQREAVTPSSQDLAGDATVIIIVGADKAP